MSETTEISRECWAEYLANLSNCEQNHVVRIQLESPELGDQAISNRLPLVGISCELKGSQKDAISITVGDQRDQSFTHLIEATEHLYVEQEGTRVVCLDFEDHAKVKTLIFFDEVQGAAP